MLKVRGLSIKPHYSTICIDLSMHIELESACLSGQGCGLCIALIRPNHWAASVAQWLEHLSGKQCVVGFRRKKSCLG